MGLAAAPALRANPRYELVALDRLPRAEREALSELGPPSEIYGLLRSRPGEALGVKAVDCDTALLFLTLAEPGPLPTYVRARLGGEAPRVPREIAELVASGILEVAGEGGFVSGAAGLDLLHGPDGSHYPHGSHSSDAARASRPGTQGLLATLSSSALSYAARLQVDDPLLLAHRLYTYNRRPLTPAWVRRLSGPEAVERYLGIAPGGRLRPLLERGWVAGGSRPGWLFWRARLPREMPADPSGVTWKLYVSPATEALEEGFGEVLEGLAAARCSQWKVGDDASGLLRPDKIVAYFQRFEELAEAAGRLAGRLAGLPVHGVPMTAEIGGGGLLSWGVDPPARERRLGLGEADSWRFWLAGRLARHLLDARGLGDPEPERSAVLRLRLQGVDVDSWTPGALLFREG